MLDASHGPASTRLKAALQALQKLCVPFRGPFITPKQNLFTVNVNAHGGLLESPIRMAPGQRMTLTNPQSGKQVACTVVRVAQPPQGSLFTIAFEFAERSPRFWPLPLPPLDWAVGPEPA